MTSQMQAVVFPGDGSLVIADRPVPTPGPGQVLVKVHAAGLNRADLLQRAGAYPAPEGIVPDIPGLEFSGEVVESADDAGAELIGRRVMGIVAGGAQAGFVITDAAQCVTIPDSMSWAEAAAVPEAAFTAWDALCQAEASPGELVLINAIGSGVGAAGCRLAHLMGARVAGTARSVDKLTAAGQLGMDIGVSTAGISSAKDIAQALLSAGVSPDVTLELVGGDYVAADVAVAAQFGRIVVIGTMAGIKTEMNLLSLMTKRLTLKGTVLRSRTATEKAAVATSFAERWGAALEDGTLRLPVDAVFDLSGAEAAYAALDSNAIFGKAVLELPH
ncbi:MAG: zinc-binding dehydrogenase [Acidimicrobiia bacterium]|nr:zinc-binding dehydrogenase [Acidimicrobiia bacterium]MBP8179775.1 zinc-binding dehydrogenase [Acidimicrobiia bacterium]